MYTLGTLVPYSGQSSAITNQVTYLKIPFRRGRLTMKKSVQFTALALLCLASGDLFAQGGGQVSQTLTGYYNTIVIIGNVIFSILMVFGVIKTVSAFLTNSGGGPRNLIFLVLAAVIWFGFNLIVNDVQSASSGSTGGYTMGR